MKNWAITLYFARILRRLRTMKSTGFIVFLCKHCYINALLQKLLYKCISAGADIAVLKLILLNFGELAAKVHSDALGLLET